MAYYSWSHPVSYFLQSSKGQQSYQSAKYLVCRKWSENQACELSTTLAPRSTVSEVYSSFKLRAEREPQLAHARCPCIANGRVEWIRLTKFICVILWKSIYHASAIQVLFVTTSLSTAIRDTAFPIRKESIFYRSLSVDSSFFFSVLCLQKSAKILSILGFQKDFRHYKNLNFSLNTTFEQVFV